MVLHVLNGATINHESISINCVGIVNNTVFSQNRASGYGLSTLAPDPNLHKYWNI